MTMCAALTRNKSIEERRIDAIKKTLLEDGRNYSYLSFLGRGTFGLALLLKDNSDEKMYVGKAIYYNYDYNKQNLALNEMSALKELQHENIVQYVDCYESKQDKYVFIIMEYCPGGDFRGLLEDRVKNKQGRFEEDIVWNWSLQMFRALGSLFQSKRVECLSGSKIYSERLLYMHGRRPKVLHRDLKPENIFLSADLKIIKLGDFGCARSLATLDTANTLCGTPQYLSPELLKGENDNHKADVWSAGCCTYEMIVLEPFMEDIDLKKQTFKSRPMPVGYNEELVSIVQEMLVVDPETRIDIASILQKPSVTDVISTLQRKMSTLTLDMTPGPGSMNPNLMLKNLDEDSQHLDPEETLTSLGYQYNDELQLKSLDGATYNHDKDGDNYEEICYATRSLLIKKMSNDYNMRRLDLPFGCAQDKRTSFVYVSYDIFSNNSKVLILVHGSGRVSAGEWSRKLMINESLLSGSQIPWIVEAQNKGYALIIANLNNMYNDTDSGYADPKEINREGHLEHIMEVVNNRCPASKAAVLAHSYGGSALLNVAVTQESTLRQKTFSVVFADSTHESLAQRMTISANLKNFFSNKSRHYIPNDTVPLGNPIPSTGSRLSPAYSAGSTQHVFSNNLQNRIK